MKRSLVLTIAIIAILTFAVIGFASTGAENSPPVPQQPAAATQQVPATVGDAMEKALNMIDQLATVVGAQIKEKSPLIWMMFVKKTMTAGILECTIMPITAIIFIVLAVLCRREDKKTMKKNDNGEHEWSSITVFFLVVAVITGIIAFILLPFGVMNLTNAEYYATKELLRIALDPSNAIR